MSRSQGEDSIKKRDTLFAKYQELSKDFDVEATREKLSQDFSEVAEVSWRQTKTFQQRRREADEALLRRRQHANAAGRLARSSASEGNTDLPGQIQDERLNTHGGTAFWDKVGFFDRHQSHGPSHDLVQSEKEIKKLAKRTEALGPVAEQYDLTINQVPTSYVMLLQYPDRDDGQLYCSAFGRKPLQLRIKPKCGLVEVVIPLTFNRNYNIRKGRKFGSALRSSDFSKKKAPYLPDERARGAPGKKKQADGDLEMTDAVSEADEASDDGENSSSGDGSDMEEHKTNGHGQTDSARRSDMNGYVDDGGLSGDDERSGPELNQDSDDAIGEGHLMDTFTLEGRIMPLMEGDPLYMVATFVNDTCTWTKVDAIVSLRPQFAHLDALRAQSKPHGQNRQDENIGSGERQPIRDIKAQDVNLRIKDTEDPESAELHYGGIPETMKLLRQMAEEPWQPLEWIDQDDTKAYKVFDETLIPQGSSVTPQLVSKLSNEQYLDAISCPRVDPIRQGQKIMHTLDSDSDWSQKGESASASEIEEEDEDVVEQDHGVSLDDSAHKGRKTSELDVKMDSTGRKTISKDELLYGWRPKGKPEDRSHEVRMERTCRLICLEPSDKHEEYYRWLYNTKKQDPRFSFLDPRNASHHYFLWRLSENRSGRGIPPEHDTPERPSQTPGQRRSKNAGRKATRGRRT